MEENTVKNSFASIYIDNGIIYGIYNKDLTIDLDAAKSVTNDRKKVSEFSSKPMFVDGTTVKSITKEARDFFGSEEGSELLSASAIYTNSRLSAFLANFFIKVNLTKTKVPVKLFTDKDKAIQWLERYK